MSIIRSLESFSLPELFQLIDNDSKSGRLIIETPISKKTDKREGIYYIWFEDGCLVAVSDCLNQKGLINLIAGRGWLSPAVISRLRTLCPTAMPLGNYLQKMKLINQQKLSLIFQLQLHQVYRLFQLTGGRFRFDDFSEMQDRILTVPWLEMTGHRIRTNEVTMYALRLMEHRENFGEQLPEPNLAIRRIATNPHLKLTATERKLWNLADGQTSLINLAKIMEQPLSTVQITAFRLIAVGLVDGIFQSSYDWERLDYPQARRVLPQSNEQSANSASEDTSLFDSLGTFFKKGI